VHNVFEIQEQQENQPPLQEDTVGNHEQPLQQNEKKRRKLITAKSTSIRRNPATKLINSRV
jgi:hypothetical protein